MFRKIFTGGAPKYLIVGLGNPGAKYESTRHNAGWLALDSVASAIGCEVKKMKFQSLCATAVIGETPVLLMKPTTFMNDSGIAVAEAARYYGIAPENVVILYDDVALPVGAMRIRTGGSAGGHNGMKSVIEWLDSENFPRVRFGVGAPPPGYELIDYVLGRIPANDRKAIESNFPDLLPALELIVSGKLELAMSRFNKHSRIRTDNEANT